MRKLVTLSAAALAVLTAAGAATAVPAPSVGAQDTIMDTFSCDGRSYGYYADPDDEQVYYVCLPQRLPDGTVTAHKLSFFCPSETYFSEETFTCERVNY